MRSPFLVPLLALVAVLSACRNKPDPCAGANSADSPECGQSDADGDGYTALVEGGDDCDDTDAGISPDAPDIPYDGIDQDCNGADLTDVDADGHDGSEVGGDDCDDADASSHPGAAEIPYDGTDQDCDGADLTDVDGDGHMAVEAGGDDCDDADPGVYPNAAEVQYDGIDQDCDGADVNDLDGDGFIGSEAGGDDCDDANMSIHPGAVERCDSDRVDEDCDGLVDDDDPDVTRKGTMYADEDGDGYGAGDALPDAACHAPAGESARDDDCNDADPAIAPGAAEVVDDGIDQDCDGLDAVDGDGDGYASTETGGPDCDDTDPAIGPGATESEVDGIDNDCDGRTDETLVCWDGTGDFLTVQEGVDGTPDGGTVEICPGAYTEDVLITDRVLRIEGAGAAPADTSIVGAGGWSAFYLSGEGVDLTITNVAISGPARSVTATARQHVVIDLVDFCSVGARAFVELSGNPVGVSLTRSTFCGSAYISLSGLGTFAKNVVESEPGEDSWVAANSGDLTIRNNIFSGGGQGIYAGGDDADIHFYNNTFADGDYFQVSAYAIYGANGWSSFTFHDNIIAGMSDPSAYVFDIFYDSLSGVNYGCAYWVPSPFRANIAYDVHAAGWVECVTNNLSDEWDDSVYDYGDDPLFAAGFTDEDPMFVTSPGRGTYALDPASPGVDAGMGDPDPDGTPNDLGAFGGPDGNWWQEVPWLD